MGCGAWTPAGNDGTGGPGAVRTPRTGGGPPASSGCTRAAGERPGPVGVLRLGRDARVRLCGPRLRGEVKQLGRMTAELGEHRARKPLAARFGGRARGYVCGRGPLCRVLVQTRAYEVEERLRYAGQVRFLLRDPEEVGVQAGLRGAEEKAAGGGVDEDRAQAEHIAGRGEFESAHLLGRHEAGRADQHPGAGVQAVPGEAVHGPRDAEVDHARPVDRHQYVGRFQVAVDQARVVHRLEGHGQAVGEGADRVLGERPEVLGDHGGEVGPGDVLGRHPGHLGLGVGVEHGRRPRPAHPAGGRHLACEPLAEFGMLGVFGLHHLHGHGPSGLRTAEVHQAHAARAQSGYQAVRADVQGIFGDQLVHGNKIVEVSKPWGRVAVNDRCMCLPGRALNCGSQTCSVHEDPDLTGLPASLLPLAAGCLANVLSPCWGSGTRNAPSGSPGARLVNTTGRGPCRHGSRRGCRHCGAAG